MRTGNAAGFIPKDPSAPRKSASTSPAGSVREGSRFSEEFPVFRGPGEWGNPCTFRPEAEEFLRNTGFSRGNLRNSQGKSDFPKENTRKFPGKQQEFLGKTPEIPREHQIPTGFLPKAEKFPVFPDPQGFLGNKTHWILWGFFLGMKTC